MLDVKEVRFSHPNSDTTSFKFDLKLSRSEIMVVAGRSGTGKTTLLNLIAGFLTPDYGKILWQGKDITRLVPAKRPLSMIFQNSNLFDHLSCRINVALGLRPSLSLSAEEWLAVEYVMDELGILALQDRKPDQISGGQQQRVVLARALIRANWQDRQLLLFDEPFSALDNETRVDCIHVVKQLVNRKNIAALMVSHNPDDAKRLEANVVTLTQNPEEGYDL